MKVFDFTGKKKGQLLGEVKCPNGLIGVSTKTGMFRSQSDKYELQLGTYYSNRVKAPCLDPETYGVEAICFCIGNFSSGDSDNWEWKVIPTPSTLRDWYKDGYVRYTPHTMLKCNGEVINFAELLYKVEQGLRIDRHDFGNDKLVLFAVTRLGWKLEECDAGYIEYNGWAK